MKAKQYEVIYKSYLTENLTKMPEIEAKSKALAKVMSIIFSEIIQSFTINKVTDDAIAVKAMDIAFAKYRAFAYRISINPQGLKTMIKQVRPELIAMYEKHKGEQCSKT